MLLRHLKSLGKQIPAIMLVSDAEVSLAVDIIREGVVDFFEKPCLGDCITRRVAALLSLEEPGTVCPPVAPATDPPTPTRDLNPGS
jgi:FixJ family two-component response regulator